MVEDVYFDSSFAVDEYGDMYGDMFEEVGMGEAETCSFNPMGSIWFISGMFALALAVSVGLGILFAKLKAKKGLDVYED